MKLFITALIVFAGFSAQAEIKGSKLEKHQQKAIVTAISKTCGTLYNLVQINQKKEIVKIDQGVQDVYFTTTIQADDLLDQNTYDRYLVTVKSVLSDAYDHENKTWGVFAVENVNCQKVD